MDEATRAGDSEKPSGSAEQKDATPPQAIANKPAAKSCEQREAERKKSLEKKNRFVRWLIELGDEFAILIVGTFCPKRTGSLRSCRIILWRKHVAHYIQHKDTSESADEPEAAEGESTQPALTGQHTDFLWKHLETIDNKLARLLTFEGAASITTIFATVHAPVVTRSLKVTMIFFLGLWAAATLLCLSASYRVVWGDLWNEDRPFETYFRELTEAVVDRTAKYRISVAIIVLYVISAIVLIGGYVLEQEIGKAGSSSRPITKPISKPSPPVTVTSTPNPTPTAIPTSASELTEHGSSYLGPLRRGAACASEAAALSQIQNIANKVKAAGALHIKAIGYSDKIKLKPGALYATNDELARTRARCMAGWLADNLAGLGYRVDSIQIEEKKSANPCADGYSEQLKGSPSVLFCW